MIADGGRLTLADAGFPAHYDTFLDLDAVLLTHAHADHTGLPSASGRKRESPVFVHEDDRRSIGRVLQLPWWGLLSNAWRPFVGSMLGHAIGAGVFSIPSIREARTFRDGDVIDVPGKPLVLHTPGHTAGEVCFYLPERRVLIIGDTLVTKNPMTGTPGGPQVPHRLLNDNDTKARRSLDRLRELGHVTVLPGQGTPWTGPMAEAIEDARGTALP